MNIRLVPKRAGAWRSPPFYHNENHSSERHDWEGMLPPAFVTEHALWVQALVRNPNVGKIKPQLRQDRKARKM